MRRSEERKRAKVLESACGKGSKGFWKAIKEVTNENEPQQKTLNTQTYSTKMAWWSQREK